MVADAPGGADDGDPHSCLHDVLLRVEPACHTGPVCGVMGMTRGEGRM
jgi:hypothetical protein